MACVNGCGAVTPSQAHCSVCHHTFGGVRGFDRHRRDGQCLDPVEMGYELKQGVWRLEMSTEARNRFSGGSGNPTEDGGS